MCVFDLFWLAPHFKQLLKDVVKKEEAYVLLFDESLNSVASQSKWIFTFVHGIMTNIRLKVAIIPQCLWVMAQQTTCFLIFVQA